MSLSVTTIDDITAIRREDWNTVVARCPDSSVFQSYEWVSTWWRRFNDETDHLRIVAAFENHSLVGLALLCEVTSEHGGHELVFLGDGHASHQTFPVVSGRLDIVHALIKEVIDYEARGIEVALREIPQFSTLSLCLAEMVGKRKEWQQAITPCSRLRVRGNTRFLGTRFGNCVPGSRDSALCRAEEISVLHFTDSAQILKKLSGSTCPQNGRWADTETPNLFETESDQDFYRELIEAFAGTERLLFTAVELNGYAVAQHLGFCSHNALLWYHASFNVAFAYLSPQELLLESLVEYAHHANIESLDLPRRPGRCTGRFASTVTYNVAYLRPANEHVRYKKNTGTTIHNDLQTLVCQYNNNTVPIKVLVLDAESRAGIEVVQSLGRAGACVDAAISREVAPWRRSRRAARYIRQPTHTDASYFITWLRAKCTESGYTLIVPATEQSLKLMAELQDNDPLRSTACLPSRHALSTALNKQLTHALAVSNGVRVPHSRLISKGDIIPPADAYPVVLKPVISVVVMNGSLQRLAPVIAQTAAERSAALSRLLKICAVQEQHYISGVGVGVECLYRYGSLECCFVHERLHELPLTGGGSTYRSSLPLVPEVVGYARCLLDALAWHGVAMVEFKRAIDGTYWLMEINPRFWGSLALSIDAGVDFPRFLAHSAVGVPALPQPKYRVGYSTRYFPADVDWMKENLRANHQDPLLLTHSRVKAFVEYFRPLIGRESWDHFDRGDLGVVLGQMVDVLTALFSSAVKQIRAAISRFRLAWAHRHTMRRLRREQKTISRVLFVCYGNICRSPFAEIVTRKMLNGLEAISAGFYPVDRRTTPVQVQLAAEELGIGMAMHRSQRLDSRMVMWADIIIVMDCDNFGRLCKEFPHAREKVLALGLLSNPATPEIPDPYEMDVAQTRTVLKSIQKGIEGLAALMRKEIRTAAEA